MNGSNTTKRNDNYLMSIEKRARLKLIKRYEKSRNFHDSKMINDILYNEKTHYVEQFKEYLIYEDYNEFLKRFYKSTELNVKLPKILNFYEKYSKIYANYTVIPESKYMYKNIKRKQKIIDQMQNNDIHETSSEEDEESNDDLSNTVFSSRIMHSLFNKTLTDSNKSDKNEKSLNEFISKIYKIENEIKKDCLQLNKDDKNVRKKKELILPMKKISKELLYSKYIPNTTKLTIRDLKNNAIDKSNNGNNSQKIKNIEVQFTFSNKNCENSSTKKFSVNNSNNNNINLNNTINRNSNLVNPNLLVINTYMHNNNKSNIIFNSNNSFGNINNSNYYNNNTTTFQGQKSSLKTFSKQKLPTGLIKQNNINNTYINKNRENIGTTKINNYFSNATKREPKYKLSLGETLLKYDKIVLSTNSCFSPNTNINNNGTKKQSFMTYRQKEKITPNQSKINNKLTNNKKVKSKINVEYNSIGNSLSFLPNKVLECKNNKKKVNKCLIEVSRKKISKLNNKDIENNLEGQPTYRGPESNRNNYHSKILSENNLNNKFNENYNNNVKNKFKLSVGLKNRIKNNAQKILSVPGSPYNSSSNFFFKSKLYKLNTHKNANNLKANIKKTLDEYIKKKIVHNYNIVNNIHDNSTQINIYTGNDLYKSLHFHNNSLFNNSNLTPGSRSPLDVKGVKKKKQSNNQKIVMNSTCNSYFQKSNIKGREKHYKYNLNLKKIINNRLLEYDNRIVSDRQVTHKRFIEKLGKYFFKDKNIYLDSNNKNVQSENNSNLYLKSNQIEDRHGNNYMKQNYIKDNNNNIFRNNNNIKKNANKNYNKLINKIINKNNNNNYNTNRILKIKTNNNTPTKNKNNRFVMKNIRNNESNMCLSPQYKNNLTKIAKQTKSINYMNFMNNLNDMKNFGIDEGKKLLLHSERNKNNKIIFK